jgi:hypothetical protein
MSLERYSKLIELGEFPFPVFASPGAERRAQGVAARCQNGHRFLSARLGFEPEIRLLVLLPEHWQEYTGSPMFGVPQTIDLQTVVVAGQNSELWDMIIPPMESLPPLTAQSMRSTYGQPGGRMDIAAYMDLLAVHEVGHLFVDQGANQFDFHLPRRWLVELFCHLGLHAYVAAEEPDQMPCLEVFPQAITARGGTYLQHRSLGEFERVYAKLEPPNFVWYLSRLHTAAKHIYTAAGVTPVRRLYELLVRAKDNLPDEQLAAVLWDDVHPEVAKVLTSWASDS